MVAPDRRDRRPRNAPARPTLRLLPRRRRDLQRLRRPRRRDREHQCRRRPRRRARDRRGLERPRCRARDRRSLERPRRRARDRRSLGRPCRHDRDRRSLRRPRRGGGTGVSAIAIPTTTSWSSCRTPERACARGAGSATPRAQKSRRSDANATRRSGSGTRPGSSWPRETTCSRRSSRSSSTNMNT